METFHPGTGAIGLLWYNFPYADGSTTIDVFTYIFFFLNLFLFILFNVVTAMRYFMFPKIWLSMIHHPTQSLFLATYPMSVSTLVNLAVDLLYVQGGFGGAGFLYTLWVLWWLDVFLSALSAYGVVHLMFTRQKHTLESITATWLLPITPLVTSSATGGILAAPLLQLSPSKSLVTLVVATVLVIMGLALTFMILTLYFLHLVVHGIPRSGGVVSVYIPLGPLGQGGYSILLLGSGYNAILPLRSGSSTVLRSETVGQIISVAALAVALVLWAVGTLWLLYGLMATADVLSHDHVHFKQAFWSLLFPNGVYANLTIELYQATEGAFFRVWGTIYAGATLLVWVWVFVRTCTLVYNGAMFRAPCIDDVDIHAAAIEKDAKARHATFVLSAMEGADANGEGEDGGLEGGQRIELGVQRERELESGGTVSSGRRTMV
ncbi:voltage-dependent anion channel-domain-containing protein [Ganoderma leucocontextum]|nr:voltage-dependent anion channel-domain-containing protein [Ganoderma leucocontextum]